MRLAAISLLTVALLVSPRASANVAAASERAARVAGPRFVAGTRVRVIDEELAITCTESERAPTCRFQASYRITNPESTREDVYAAFYGVRTSEVKVTIDGVPLAIGGLSSEVQKALHEAAFRSEGSTDPHDQVGRLDPEARFDDFPFKLVVEPGATRTLRVTGVIAPGARFSG